MDSAVTEQEGRSQLHRAMVFLALRCDGAQAIDDAGFAKPDVTAGHGLAHADPSTWDDALTRAAWELARKYQGQLTDLDGFAFDAIAEPAEVPGGREVAIDVYRRHRAVSEALVSLVSDQRGEVLYGISFPWEQSLLDAVRAIPGRRWEPNRRMWVTPRGKDQALAICALGISAEDDAEKALAEDCELPAAPDNGVHLADGHLIVCFDYDPDLVADMKRVPGARWDGKTRVWSVPLTSGGACCTWADAAGIAVDEDVRTIAAQQQEAAEALAAASRSLDAEVDVAPLAFPLRPFQRAGVAYALRARRTFVADEMGLGKTVQAIAAVETAQSWPAIVVCPASLKQNWANEIAMWTSNQRSTHLVEGTTPQPLPEADYVVVNYDILDARVEDLLAVEANTLVLDESQAVKSAKAQRTKAAKRLAKAIPHTGMVLCLTGTPVLNRPSELIEQLRVLGRLEALGGWHHFATRYCRGHQGRFGWDLSGASHTDELHDALRSLCMVRRTKADVMPELPPVQVSKVVLPLSAEGAAEYRSAENDVIAYLMKRAAQIAAEIGEDPRSAAVVARIKAEAAEHLVRINALRQIGARAKLPAVLDWTKSFLESGEPLIIFAWHQEVQHALVEALDAVHILGGEPLSDIEDAKARFQAREAQTIVCSIQAAKEGHTLTAASNVVFVEEAWTPAAIAQCTARAYGRLSDAHGVVAWHLLGMGTIDAEIAAMVAQKAAVVDAVTDGKAMSSGSALGGVLASLTQRGLSEREEAS